MNRQRTARRRAISTLTACVVLAAGAVALQAPTEQELPLASEPGAALPADPVRQLRLVDGRILWGWIEEHSIDGLDVLRLDNGGRATLPWSMLDPAQRLELEQVFGYVDLNASEPTVLATRLRTLSGDEFVGLVLSETAESIEFKIANGILTIPRMQLAGPLIQEQVSAREVFTRDELYAREFEQYAAALVDEAVSGAEKAEMHFELARYCESILDFQRADWHYRAIAEADPEFDHPELAASLDRAARLALAQGQADELDEIDRLRLRDEFPEALARIERFLEVYPESPLETQVLEQRARVVRDRERDMLREAESRWHYWARRLAREQASNDSYEGTLTWIQEALSDEIVARVRADLLRYQDDVDEARVRDLWAARAARRDQRATYGVGTWLIGRDAARAEVVAQAGAERESESDARSQERKELEERIQSYLKSQQLASTGGGRGGADAADPADFWEQWTALSRTQWILAYYAENSGDMRVTRAAVRPCRECGGTGVLEVSSAGPTGGTRLNQCHLCSGVAVIRRVSYR